MKIYSYPASLSASKCLWMSYLRKSTPAKTRPKRTTRCYGTGPFLAALMLAHTVSAAAPHLLDIDNRVPQFETFFTDATRQPLTEDARFALWQKEDGLAAVPPGPAGDKMARALLDAAWDRYRALTPKLPALANAATTAAESTFAMVNELLGTQEVSIHSRLILYVGQFDNNAFTIPPMQGKPATVLMPVENAMLHVALAHELTHSVHLQLVGVKNSFGAPLGETMFLEGLAMRSSQRVVPGLPETAYTQMPGDKDWLAQCYEKKAAVLTAIVPELEKSGSEIAMKYTFGQGNTGMQREVYCAGWIAMGKLLDSGETLREIARVPEDRMIATMRGVLADILPLTSLQSARPPAMIEKHRAGPFIGEFVHGITQRTNF